MSVPPTAAPGDSRPIPTQPAPARPEPVASRLRLPGWRDRRLVVGVALVLGSVALGATVVGRADDTTPVYAAGHALMPGQALTAGDLRVVRVRLGGQTGRYLEARRHPAPGSVLLRSVLAGELVPRSAVGDRAAVLSRPVAVPVSVGSADGLAAGALVDLWVATKGSAPGAFEPPTALVRGAEVAWVTSGGGVLSGSTEATVRLLLTDDLVPQVLSALANGARLDVVPVPGSVPRGGS